MKLQFSQAGVTLVSPELLRLHEVRHRHVELGPLFL